MSTPAWLRLQQGQCGLAAGFLFLSFNEGQSSATSSAPTTHPSGQVVIPAADGSAPLVKRLVDWFSRQDEVLSAITIDDRRAIADVIYAEVEVEVKPKDQGG